MAQDDDSVAGPREHVLRADALRNRRVLLDTAATLLAELGVNVPVSHIAREAGLGKATVFRQFATKESLIAAVIEDQLSDLASYVDTLPGSADHFAALRAFLTASARLLSENRGVCEVMSASLADGDEEILAAISRITATLRILLTRCQQDGVVRADVTAEDLLLVLHGIAQSAAPLHFSHPGLWRRYLDLAFDSLRPAGAGELSGEAPVFPGV